MFNLDKGYYQKPSKVNRPFCRRSLQGNGETDGYSMISRKPRRVAIFIVPMLLAYALIMASFAFRPFRQIPGWGYAPTSIGWDSDGIRLYPGAALEDRAHVDRVRKALVKSGALTLDIEMRTDSLKQAGPSVVFGLSRNNIYRSFMFGQQGNGVEFRLSTGVTDPGGLHGSLLVPGVLDANAMQRFTATYDGEAIKLYLNGRFLSEKTGLESDFNEWGRNLLLVVGDEPTGGNGWSGVVRSVALFDRVLQKDEIDKRVAGDEVPGAVLEYGFGSNASGQLNLPEGLARLRYRNLFITTDPSAYDLDDCLFNIAGFIPLGVLAYIVLPMRMEKRKAVALLVPLLASLAASGTIEFVQCFVDGRVPCLVDLIYNSTGGLIGGLLAWLAHSTFTKTAEERIEDENLDRR